MPKPEDLIIAAIHEHHTMVYRLAYRVLSCREDAEDVTQETFLRLLQRFEKDEILSVRSWVARVALNTAYSRSRSDRKRTEREVRFGFDAHLENTSMGSLSQDLNECVQALPEELRIPLVMHYVEGFKYREVAEVLEWPEGTVSKRLSLAKEKLRIAMKGKASLAGMLPTVFESELRNLPTPCPKALEETLIRSIRGEVSASTLGSSVSTAAEWVAEKSVLSRTALWIVPAAGITLALTAWNFFGGSSISRDSRESSVVASHSFLTPPSESSAGTRETVRPSGVINDDTLTPLTRSKDSMTVSIRGVVREANGRAIVGAKVRVLSALDFKPLGHTTTDAQGSYAIDDLPYFEANSIGSLGLPVPSQRRLRDSSAMGADEGPKLSDPSVDWSETQGIQQSVDRGPVGYSVDVQAEGYVPSQKSTHRVEPGELIQHDFTLKTAATLCGTVLSEFTPLPGAEVTLVACMGLRGELGGAQALLNSPASRTRADHLGQFALSCAPRGHYVIRIDADGFRSREILMETDALRTDVELKKWARIGVNCHHMEKDLPVRNAQIALYERDRQVLIQTSDHGGDVVFDNLSPGLYTVAAIRSNHIVETQEVRLVPGDDVTLTLALNDGVPVSGRIDTVALGITPRNLTLLAVSSSALIKTNRVWGHLDNDGIFGFPNLTAGDYELMILKQPGKGRTEGLVARKGLRVDRMNPSFIDWKVPPWNPAKIEVTARDQHSAAPVKIMIIGYTSLPRVLQFQGMTAMNPVASLYPSSAAILLKSHGYQDLELSLDGLRSGESRRISVSMKPKSALEPFPVQDDRVVIAQKLSLGSYLGLLSLMWEVAIDTQALNESLTLEQELNWNLDKPREVLANLGLGWRRLDSGYEVFVD